MWEEGRDEHGGDQERSMKGSTRPTRSPDLLTTVISIWHHPAGTKTASAIHGIVNGGRGGESILHDIQSLGAIDR